MALEDEEQPNNDDIETLQSIPESVLTFPMEIIVEILLRLPVESLLRCRSVCKSWLSLISDPHFVKSHYSLSTRSNHYAHHRMIFHIYQKRIIIKTCGLYDVMYHSSVNNALELDHPLKHERESVSVIGSCNGLLCLCMKKCTLIVLNPSTRKCIRLPDCTRSSLTKFDQLLHYGFGYEELNDDYKVVVISSIGDDGNYESRIKICSLKNGNWKAIGDFRHDRSLLGYGTFLNGALHWLMWDPHKDGIPCFTSSIFYVDLAKEVCGEVLQPVYDEGERDYRLGTLREQLCVLCNYDKIRADVWVMKEYGVKDSWTKLVSIPCMIHPWAQNYSVPLSITNDGKILLQQWAELFVYDSKNGSFSEVQSECGYQDASTFVESLVSLPKPASGLEDRQIVMAA